MNGFRSYQQGLRELERQRERLRQTFREGLRRQSQNVTSYTREYLSASAFKKARDNRKLLHNFVVVRKQLEKAKAIPLPKAWSAIPVAEGLSWSTLFWHLQRVSGLDAYALERQRDTISVLEVYRCPFTSEILLSRRRANYKGPLEKYIKAGAVIDQFGNWHRSQEAMNIALKMTERLVLKQGDIQVLSVRDSDIQAATLRKDRLGREVLVLADTNSIASYHSGIENKVYDDSPRHVGIEIEVNAGSHGSSSKSQRATDILLATARDVKVERDGTVTGFEIITGHGKPSSVRQALSPIFRDKLLAGFRTGARTGGHVHVTASEDEIERVRTTRHEYYAMLQPLYAKAAERNPTSHCAGGVSSNRYSAVNLDTPHKTVEFRLFRSQLKLGKLMRNAQLAWAFMELLGEFVAKPADCSLERFTAGVADLPRDETLELRAWLASLGHKVPHVPSEFRKTYRSLGVPCSLA